LRKSVESRSELRVTPRPPERYRASVFVPFGIDRGLGKTPSGKTRADERSALV
jgi:hypothetical protein